MNRYYLFVLLMVILLSNIVLVSSYNGVRLYPFNKYLLPPMWRTVDRDGDNIDDLLENVNGDRVVKVFVVFEHKPLPIYRYYVGLVGGRVLYEYRYVLNGYFVEIKASNIPSLVYLFRQIDVDMDGYSDLLYIQMPRTYKPLAHWAVREIDVRPRVWDLGYLGENVRVAVLDTGIYLGGRGFNNSNVEFYDLVNSKTTPYDDVGHGTMVSYLIAGNLTSNPSLGEGSNEILTTYINYVYVETDLYYYVTGPFMVTGNASELKIYGMVVMYDQALQGVSNFLQSAYLVHYPSYVVDDFNKYDQAWALNINYSLLSNGYYLANLTLANPLSNPPKGLYYIFVKFASNALNYYAEVMGVCYTPLMNTDSYPIHSGVAPKAGLVVFKVGDNNGIYTNLAAQALDTISSWNNDTDPSNDVNIASMSFGGPSNDPTLYTAIKNALNYGVLSVVAAGNDGPGANNAGNTYPAAYPEVLTVAATNTVGNITDYSSQGGLSAIDSETIKPDVAAPGGSYYGPLAMRDSDQDGEVTFETGDSFEIEYNDTQTGMGTSFATPIVSGLAALIIEVFKEKGVWRNDRFHALLVKSIIMASSYETYPLIREKNVTYSPTLDRGVKDPHEGMGMVDGYTAIRLANYTADLLRYWNGLSTSYSYDYGLNDDYAPFILWRDVLRQGVIYNVSDINTLLNVPFGPSTTGLPVHFERYVWNINGVEYPSIYGVRLIANTSDQLHTDFDTYIYLYNSSTNEVTFLNRSNGGVGVLDETLYFTPPVNESNTDYIYYVVVKRVMENATGGEVKLCIGPGLEARFVNGRYIWINTTAATSSSSAKYALILVYYRNASGTYIHRQVIAETSDLNGYAHVEGYINIIKGLEDGVLERLQDDYEWYVGVIYTYDKRSLSNLTRSSVVEGPVVVSVDIGEPTILDISAPSNVTDNTLFNITARLLLNDTGSPLTGRTIYFYRSTDLSHWTLIGSNTTDINGYAELWISEDVNGSVYYLALYLGDNTTQYTWTGYAVRTDVYMRTNISLTVSDTTPYTVEPVNITVKLTRLVSGTPIPGENVTVWISYDNGVSWNKLVEGVTDTYGTFNYTHLFLSNGTYLLKANYSGNTAYYYLSSESSIVEINVSRTPTNASISINNTDLRVYDIVGFTIQLNYTYDSVTGPVGNALVYLELFNNTWVIVDQDYTDRYGYVTLTYSFTRNGTYVFRIHYTGNNTYVEYLSSNISLTVLSLATTINILSKPVSGYVGQTLSTNIRLVDEKNRGVGGETVYLLKNTSSGWLRIANATTDSDGYATLYWSENTTGNYSYRIVYDGKPYIYNSSESSIFNVTILKATTSLSLTSNVSSTVIREHVLLTAQLLNDSSPISGEIITFEKWDGATWIVLGTNTTDSNGYATFIVSEDYAGNYTYRAVYNGSATYSSATSNNVTVEYKPITTTLSLTIPSSAYTVDEVLLEAVLTTVDGDPVSNYNVSFWISSDAVNWIYLGSNTTDSNGRAVYRHVFWVNGTYYVKANFTDPGKNSGTWIYSDSESSIESISIELTPVNISLSSNASTVYINESIELLINATDIYGEPLSNVSLDIYFNGSFVASVTTDSNGIARYTVSQQYYMIYNVTIHYSGNNTYNESYSNYIIVEWKPLPTQTSLSIDNIAPQPGDTITLTANVIDTVYNKPVVNYEVKFWVKIGAGNWVLIGTATTNSSGYASITYRVTGTNTYYFKANFTDPNQGVMGSWVYGSSESNVIMIIPGTIPTNLSLSPNTTYTYIGEYVNLTARLTMINGTPIQGETIDFYIYLNGAWQLLGSATTDSGGYAWITDIRSIVGNYTYRAVYSGSGNYLGSESSNVTVEFDKRPTEITIIYIEPSQPYVNDTITIKIRLTSLGEPVGLATITLYNDTYYLASETTGLDGEAVFTVEFSEAGVYTLVFRYSGSDTYKPTETSYDLVVKHYIKLVFTVKHRFLDNGSLLFILIATLYLDNQPYSNQSINFYLKGSWIYLGTNTTNTSGVAVYYYLTNQTVIQKTYTFKANYSSTTVTIDSVAETKNVVATLPKEYWRPPPTPELNGLIITSLLLLLILIIIIQRSRKKYL